MLSVLMPQRNEKKKKKKKNGSAKFHVIKTLHPPQNSDASKSNSRNHNLIAPWLGSTQWKKEKINPMVGDTDQGDNETSFDIYNTQTLSESIV